MTSGINYITDTEKLTDVTITYRPPKKLCERCRHYETIDSGYGKCKRFPPIFMILRRFPFKATVDFPSVAWCERACGEYEVRNK